MSKNKKRVWIIHITDERIISPLAAKGIALNPLK